MKIKNDLIKKIKHKKAVVGIIGLGYVGLPLALECCKKGFKTIGFDIDVTRIEELEKGKDRTLEVTSKNIQKSMWRNLVPELTFFFFNMQYL